MFWGVQNQINTLEILIEDDKQKSIQIEILKHEKTQLISELAAKESLIYGLRTERKVWGHELAHQGKSQVVKWKIAIVRKQYIWMLE